MSRSNEIAPTTMVVVEPGGGEAIPGATLIGRAEWTDGAVCVLEQTVEPGVLVAAHSHQRETQCAYVLSGSITFHVDGREASVGPGGYVVRPAGSVHALWNAGPGPARMLEITSPAATWQRFAVELGALHARGGDAHELAALAERHGTRLAPDVTAELAARHGLRTSTGYSTD
jgi:mannose-6-phosphate isomerase-like protein (cupin superfamily)